MLYYCNMQVVVSQKGQITIPAFLRKIFDINPKDEVVFKATEEGILIQKSTSPKQALFGSAAKERQIPFISLSKVRKQVGRKLGKRYKVKTSE